MLFLIPLIDMTYVIYMRIKFKKSPFFPDRSHLHQRLLNKGYSEDFTLKYIYLSNLRYVPTTLYMKHEVLLPFMVEQVSFM